MTLLYMESFDHIHGDFWDDSYNAYKASLVDYGSGGDSTSVGWLGVGKCHETLDDFTYAGGYSYFIPQSNTVIVGLAFKTYDLNDQSLIRIRRGGNTQVDLALDANGGLIVRRGGSTTIGTSSRRFPTKVWNFIEFKVTIGDSGSFELRVDGETVCSASGVDTQALTDGGATCVSIGPWGGFSYKLWWDDLYICNSDGSVNNDFLGAVRIDVLVPDGAGSSTQWTPSTGSNYACVDETIHTTSDADYVSTYTDNNIDTYAFGTLSFTPSAIKGVQVNAAAKRTSVQNRNLQLVTRISSTNYTSATHALRSTEKVHSHLMETNPNTGTAWTKAVIDGAEFGVKAV